MPVRYLLALSSLFAFAAHSQTEIILTPSRDTVLFESNAELSSGQGVHLFAGRLLTGERRRSLIRFNFSVVPAGATILDARLTLYLSKTQSSPVTVSLHRASADWGEAGSDSGFGGIGANAELGDATWRFRVFDQQAWQSEGGDFVSVASAQSLVLGLPGPYDWSDVRMQQDVRRWIDNPTQNYGWMLVGAENSGTQTAMRFASRENSSLTRVPTLTVRYQPDPTPTGPAPATVPALGGTALWLLVILVLLLGLRSRVKMGV